MADSDPAKLRAVAAAELGRWFANYGVPGDQVGVGWFADAVDLRPPGPPDQVVTSARQGPGQLLGGGTAIAPAIRAAGSTLADCAPGSRPVLVLVSDGITDEGWDLVRGALDDLPPATAVHMMAMDEDGGFSGSDAKPFWTDPTRGLVTVDPVTHVNAASITGPLAHIVSDETGQFVERRSV